MNPLACIVVLALSAPADADAIGVPDELAALVADLDARERRRIASLANPPAPPPDPSNRAADDEAAAALGHLLFFDARLSADGTVSCATCHVPDLAFTDGKPRSVGRAEVARNAPTVVGAAHQRWLFWDGRADSLWMQALQPIEDSKEHAFDRVGALRVVASDERLRSAYESVFGALPRLDDAGRVPPNARPVPDRAPPDELDAAWRAMPEDARLEIDLAFSNLGKAIEAYERKLQPGDAPFDRFVTGMTTGDAAQLGAISAAALRGARLFVGEAGCRTCHFGPLLSDGEFHSTGVPPRGGGPLHDPGRFDGIRRLQESRFNATGPFSDAPEGMRADATRSIVRSSELWGTFRTPSLRNVARTAPYMHEGQYETLGEVLRHYSTLEDAVLPGHHQEQVLKPLQLSDDQLADLEAFLRSLTGLAADPAWLAPPAGRPGESEPH